MKIPWPILRAAVSVLLLGLVIAQVEILDLWSYMASANLVLVAAGFAAAIASWCVNTQKWGVLLKTLGEEQSFWSLLALNFTGLFYSLVLPGQVSGEVVKGMRLSKLGVRVSSVAVSIAVDRATGVVALAVFILVGTLLAPRVPLAGPVSLAALALLAVIFVPWLLVVTGHLGNVSPTLRGGEGLVGAVLRATSALWNAFVSYRKPSVMGVALLYSFAAQLLVVVSNYMVAQALNVPISFVSLTWVVAAVSILHLAPISLAGLGVREGAYVFLLYQYGVPTSQGLGLSLLVFGIILGQGLIGGVIEAVSAGRILSVVQRH
ncbi:MAG: hypothetical protein HW403_407 [Dehalococcoidia bacterium]|nr:hypothetical protein [Dehalococcoidia bacterium]